MKTVLVVEDSSLLRANIVAILQLENLTVFEAEDGQQGIDLAKAHLPNLILCDLNLPTVDGYEVYAAVQADPNTAKIPFLFLTAEDNPILIEQKSGIDRDHIILKPFDVAGLLDRLKHWLG